MKVLIHHFDQNAHAMIRFGKDIEIAGIYDERPELNGKDSGELLGIGKNGIIISSNFSDVLESSGAELMITTGEGLYFTNTKKSAEWERNTKSAINSGLNIYSMSKILYGEKTSALRKLAVEKGCDFREASDQDGWERFIGFAEKAESEGIEVPRINFTGTSMNSGKVTALFTAKNALEKIGLRVGVVGTEPCSVFIGADEQVIPEVYPTFKGAPAILGAIKKIEVEKKPNIILIGNQTGLRSSVTDVKESRAGAIVAWQILLGSKPTKIILCSKWNKVDEIGPHIRLIKDSGIQAPVIGNVINGNGCKREKLMETLVSVENEFSIPSMDVISTPEKLDGLVKGMVD